MQTTSIEELRRVLAEKHTSRAGMGSFRTGLGAWDAASPNGVFQGGAVHELLWQRKQSPPTSLALYLAATALSQGGTMVWSDPERELYIPAVSAMRISLRHLILLRCANREEQLWALVECLRCRGIAATVATLGRLSQIEARKLQLAAESGGSVGVFMRPDDQRISTHYAAATRWFVEPAPGDEQAQRWSVQLRHGHGGQIGKVLLLEADRDTCALRALTPLADRSAAATTTRATA